MAHALFLRKVSISLQPPSARLVAASVVGVSLHCAKTLGRFILFTGLRGFTAQGAYIGIKWCMQRTQWDKGLKAYLLPKLEQPVGALKKGLKPHGDWIVNHASSKMNRLKQFFLWLSPPNIQEHIDKEHAYVVINEVGLTLASTCVSKLIVGGSFFDALCSGLIVRIGCIAHAQIHASLRSFLKLVV